MTNHPNRAKRFYIRAEGLPNGPHYFHKMPCAPHMGGWIFGFAPATFKGQVMQYTKAAAVTDLAFCHAKWPHLLITLEPAQ